MKTTTINLTIIIALISGSLIAQQNYELSDPVNGTNMYIAPNYVKMLPGFHAQPTGNEYVLAKINPYILTGGTTLPHDIEPPISTSSSIPV